ncbi:hypothetical protein F5B18DRAFT_674758 [Nemania serpens]|nr:hypothetical protein F5B18DRAFT_674758 [Nemania serpens]
MPGHKETHKHHQHHRHSSGSKYPKAHASTSATGGGQGYTSVGTKFPRSAEDRKLERMPVKNPRYWQGPAATNTWNFVQSGEPTKTGDVEAESTKKGDKVIDRERAHNVIITIGASIRYMINPGTYIITPITNTAHGTMAAGNGGTIGAQEAVAGAAL